MRRASKAFGRKLMKNGWSEWENKYFEAKERGIKFPEGLKDVYQNNLYVVQFFEHASKFGIITHLHIRRNDEAPVKSWYDMQRIKDELIGQERLGIEVYPPRSQLVDGANNYHIWVFPEGFQFDFGLHL